MHGALHGSMLLSWQDCRQWTMSDGRMHLARYTAGQGRALVHECGREAVKGGVQVRQAAQLLHKLGCLAAPHLHHAWCSPDKGSGLVRGPSTAPHHLYTSVLRKYTIGDIPQA